MKRITLIMSTLVGIMFSLPGFADEDEGVTYVTQPAPMIVTEPERATTVTTVDPEGDIYNTTAPATTFTTVTPDGDVYNTTVPSATVTTVTPEGDGYNTVVVDPNMVNTPVVIEQND